MNRFLRPGGFLSAYRSIPFALWSLRRRADQLAPVAVALLLLVGAVQIIGMLHDVSSVLTQQQIARSWRGSYDLLARPRSAVSEPEERAGWISPQSALESYGGISDQQLAAIRILPHVSQVVAFATVGWQPVDAQAPILFAAKGVYRVTAQWSGQGVQQAATVRYVEVTDVAHLMAEQPLSHPLVLRLVMQGTTPLLFYMPVQAVQALVGVPSAQQAPLAQALLQGLSATPPVQLSIQVAKLQGDIQALPACLDHAQCWQSLPLQPVPLRFEQSGVQLLRYSPTHYSASAQQLASGQLAVNSLGSDAQGPLYRTQLTAYVPTLDDQTQNEPEPVSAVLPFAAPERLPLLAGAVRFIPLDEACKVNGTSCYSGLYVRLHGVDHYSRQSLALLQATAAAIAARTGLYVDILDGSSPRQVAITGAANTAQVIQSSWLVVGVAVQIVQGVDALQEILLALCSLICLLAIGAAGVLVGISRKNDATLLGQLGWPGHVMTLVMLLDAFLLALPGLVLAASFLFIARLFWPNNLPAQAAWLLLGLGLFIYCSALVGTAYYTSLGATRIRILPPAPASVARWLQPLRRYSLSQAFHEKITAPLVCALSVALAVFLIAIEYVLAMSLNQALVVTVLGRQVREALEGPQFALLGLIVCAAALTVALCTRLLLQGRRKEITLLAMLGWERRAVLLRILRDEWWPALVSGEVGALLAISVAWTSGSLPPVLVILALLCCGPPLGMLLVSVAAFWPGWQEVKRVFT